MPDSHLLNTTNIVNLDTYLANNYVTQDTGQTITGQKVFTETLYLKNNAKFNSSEVNTNTTTPSATKSFHLYHTAKDNTVMGSLTFSSNSNGKNYAYLNAQKGSVTSSVSVDVDDDGLTRAFAPTPQTSASTRYAFIATTGWVNDPDKSANVVHRSGTEEIGGSKTFTNTIYIKNGGTYSSSPQTQQDYILIYGKDSTDKLCGYFHNYTTTTGETSTRMVAFHPNDNSNYAAIMAKVASSGEHFTWVTQATDTTSTTSQQIATVGWVNKANKTGNGIGAPNYAASQIITLDSNNQYTATENGWIRIVLNVGAGVSISGISVSSISQSAMNTVFPIAKGQTMTVSGSISTLRFIPCMG